MFPQVPDLKNSVCIITGANSGIGLAASYLLALRGAEIHMVCRNTTRGEKARRSIKKETGSSKINLHIADLSLQSDIRKLAKELISSCNRINVLINNAGVCMGKRILTSEGIETTFAVNHIGVFMLTELLLDKLGSSAPARVINVNSGAHVKARMDFDNLQGEKKYSAFGAYALSKLCNLLYTFELAKRSSGTGISINAVHPGIVGTGIYGKIFPSLKILDWILKPFMLTPKEGADTIVWAATDPSLENVSGKYFAEKSVAEPSAETKNTDYQQRLHQLSLAITGLQ